MNHLDPARSAMADQGRCPWLLWLVFVTLLVWLWPGHVLVRGDDFGYLESVTETIRQGVPVSSDWIEPLNLVLPVVSAGIWHLGGSFYLATFGLLGVLALLNFHLLWLWLRPQLVAGWTGHVAVLAVALLPVGLNKTVEFTGVPLGLAMFLGALLAWRRQSPGLFLLLVLAGCLNRQSAVCLLALPAVAQLRVWLRGETPNWRWVAGVVGVGVLVGAIMLKAPDTLARALTERHQDENTVGRFAGQLLLGLGLLGGIAAGWAWLQGSGPGRGLLKLALAAVPWLLLGAGLMLTDFVALRCETPSLWRYGPLVVATAIFVAATVPGALARVAPEALAATAVYAVLVSWRGIWWDYYLCEPALLLACSAAPQSAGIRVTVPARVACAACAAVALVGLLPVWHQLRWSEARVLAYESALRAGQLEVTAASEAPFGFLGWKVFPAMVTRADEPGLRLSDFTKYIEAGRSHLGPQGIVLLPPLPDVRSLHGSGEVWPLPAGYSPRKFPLSDGEWRDWLAAQQP
jgi:hypothetical protein